MRKERVLSLFRPEERSIGTDDLRTTILASTNMLKLPLAKYCLIPSIAIEAISLQLGSEVSDTKTFEEFAEDLHKDWCSKRQNEQSR
jgi:predicted glycosyltransferase